MTEKLEKETRILKAFLLFSYLLDDNKKNKIYDIFKEDNFEEKLIKNIKYIKDTLLQDFSFYLIFNTNKEYTNQEYTLCCKRDDYNDTLIETKLTIFDLLTIENVNINNVNINNVNINNVNVNNVNKFINLFINLLCEEFIKNLPSLYDDFHIDTVQKSIYFISLFTDVIYDFEIHRTILKWLFSYRMYKKNNH